MNSDKRRFLPLVANKMIKGLFLLVLFIACLCGCMSKVSSVYAAEPIVENLDGFNPAEAFVYSAPYGNKYVNWYYGALEHWSSYITWANLSRYTTLTAPVTASDLPDIGYNYYTAGCVAGAHGAIMHYYIPSLTVLFA